MSRAVSRTLGAVMTTALVIACNSVIGVRDIFFEAGQTSSEGGSDAGDGSVTPQPDGGSDGASQPEGGGPCTDTTSSSDHCGRCGHSCLGGACVASKCQPVPLKSGISPRHVAVDKDHVFWVDSRNAQIGQVDKNGSNAIDLAIGGAKNNYPQGLAVDDTSVFWGGIDGDLHRCKIGGCANSPAKVASTTSFVDLIVDDTNVYWLEGSGPTRVMKALKNGMNQAGTLMTTIPESHRLAGDPAYLYASGEDGTIRRVAKSDSTVTTSGKAVAAAFGVTVDDTNAYFTDGDDPASINVAPKAGGANGTPLAASQHHPLSIAVDPVRIYWVNGYIGLGQNNGTVMSCAFAGCTPAPLAENQHLPISIVVDDVAIYWANFDGGNNGGGVMKLAKP